jgi:hypothetical protein
MIKICVDVKRFVTKSTTRDSKTYTGWDYKYCSITVMLPDEDKRKKC